MNVHEHAIAQNNIAVPMIESGNYQDAISILSVTLKSLKQTLVHHGGFAAPNNVNTSLNDCMTRTSPSALAVDGGIISASMQQVDFFLYDRAIAIPVARMGPSHHDCTLVSCIIIFNLALAHHLRFCKSTNPTRQIDLTKALKLYELTMKVQRGTILIDSDLLRLAALNNVGVLYRQLHNEEAATECFKFVQGMLIHFVHQNTGLSRMFALDGFIRNVSNQTSQANAAPAA
jgi:hypothetical protein